MYAKETYVYAKETYVYAKETYAYRQKRPMCMQKRPMCMRKRPMRIMMWVSSIARGIFRKFQKRPVHANAYTPVYVY